MELAKAVISVKREISVRRREPSDAKELLCLFQQPFCRLASLIDPPESVSELQSWLDGLGGQFDTVATVVNRVIALGGLYLGGGRQSHVGTLSLFVHDKFHRCGVGNMMMSVLLATADEFIGLSRVQLFVFCDNPAAISLYRKFGFEIDGRLECFARRGDSLLPVYSMARLKR